MEMSGTTRITCAIPWLAIQIAIAIGRFCLDMFILFLLISLYNYSTGWLAKCKLSDRAEALIWLAKQYRIHLLPEEGEKEGPAMGVLVGCEKSCDKCVCGGKGGYAAVVEMQVEGIYAFEWELLQTMRRKLKDEGSL